MELSGASADIRYFAAWYKGKENCPTAGFLLCWRGTRENQAIEKKQAAGAKDGRMKMKQYDYLIIGGGMTADAAVKGIRELDQTGTVGILSADSDAPYARPPLSKDLWTKDKTIADIWCGTERKGAELFQSRRVVSLDRDKQEVSDDQGDIYRYEKLLLATGGEPRRLPFIDDPVIYYRDCADYRRLRLLSEESDHFIVLGGGFIGAEMAAALRINQKQVTMIFPETAVCGRMLPAEFAVMLNKYYEDRGVTLVTGSKPSAVEVTKNGPAIHLKNDRRIMADGIVAGIGIDPNEQLARAAGLESDNGILVDEHLCTKDARIFAAGDVANFYNPVLDRRMRVEHEDNALTMGETAGRNMVGEKERYHHLPFFYSDLFDVGYEAVGETDASLETVTDLENPEDKGCIFYMEGGRVRGIVFWNVFDKVDSGRELIADPGPHSPKALAAWSREKLGG